MRGNGEFEVSGWGWDLGILRFERKMLGNDK